MKYSLAMIKGMLDRKGIKSQLYQPHPVFYSKFRFISDEHVVLQKSTLYIVENPQMIVNCNLKPEYGFILFGKPEQHLLCNCLYVSNSITKDQIVELLFRMLEKFHSMESKIAEAKRQEDGLSVSLDILAAFLQNPIYIMDARYKLIAINSSADLILSSITLKRLKEQGYMPINIVMELLQNEMWQKVFHTKSPVYTSIPVFYCPFFNCGFYIENKLQGFLIVVELNHHFRSGDADLLQQIMPHLTEMLVDQLQENNHTGLYYEFFIQDLISGKLKDSHLIKEQLQPLGWKSDDQYLALTSDLEKAEEEKKDILFSRLLHIENGKPVVTGNKLNCVFKIDSVSTLKNVIDECRRLFFNTGQKCGLSGPFKGIENLKANILKAYHALQIGQALDPQEPLFEYNDYKMEYVFSQIEKQINLSDVIDLNLQILYEYDQINHTDYFETLYEYLRNERKISVAAEALHIHRNTLLYRVNRISEIIRADLDNPDVRMELLLSYSLWNYHIQNKK